MADEPGNTPKGNGEGAAAGGGGSAPAAPSINVLLQYVKDLSFENPGAPQALIPQKSPPKIEIGVNVDATTLGSDNFEVEIGINANGTAQAEGESEGSTPPAVFAVELRYAGVSGFRTCRRKACMPSFLSNARAFSFLLHVR